MKIKRCTFAPWKWAGNNISRVCFDYCTNDWLHFPLILLNWILL